MTGFRPKQRNLAEKINVGDKLVCYLTRISRWVGIFEVLSKPFEADDPIFMEEKDPFTIRININPHVWLDPESSIPIRDDIVWKHLSFTREHDKTASQWTGKVRASLQRLDDSDGSYLERVLLQQSTSPKKYTIDDGERKKLHILHIRRPDGTVPVSVPDSDVDDDTVDSGPDLRESTRVQALIAHLGFKMGYKIWIPANDRTAVLKAWSFADNPVNSLLQRLPLNYDEATLRTIENIDVLWLKGRSIARAFEVEHTTAIYSGILRMADLLALQPNMDIRLHIVAPESRKDKVFQEIRRPVFSLLDRAPLAQCCSFLSYDVLHELAQLPHLSHLSDSVLTEYEEFSE